MKARDLTGARFVRLTAIAKQGEGKHAEWLCRGDCGRQINVRASNLKSGNTKSCGCLVPDVARGWAGTPEYTAFKNAKNRCERVNDPRFAHYGGRGVKFRFGNMDDFIRAVGPRPSVDFSLDRIDHNGDYEAGNVRWTDAKTQARNKQTSKYLTLNGETRHLKEWCEIYGQPYKRVWERLKDGNAPLEALIKPRSDRKHLRRIAFADDSQIAEVTSSEEWGEADQIAVSVVPL